MWLQHPVLCPDPVEYPAQTLELILLAICQKYGHHVMKTSIYRETLTKKYIEIPTCQPSGLILSCKKSLRIF